MSRKDGTSNTKARITSINTDGDIFLHIPTLKFMFMLFFFAKTRIFSRLKQVLRLLHLQDIVERKKTSTSTGFFFSAVAACSHIPIRKSNRRVNKNILTCVQYLMPVSLPEHQLWRCKRSIKSLKRCVISLRHNPPKVRKREAVQHGSTTSPSAVPLSGRPCCLCCVTTAGEPKHRR